MGKPTLVVVERGTYCLMAWAGPHLMNSQMSAACLCKLTDGHDGRHLCAVLGCKSWKNQQPDDPKWGEEDNDECPADRRRSRTTTWSALINAFRNQQDALTEENNDE